MPLLQQAPAVGSFDVKVPGLPPYIAGPQQTPTPSSQLQQPQNGFGQIPQHQYHAFSQGQPQTQQQMFGQPQYSVNMAPQQQQQVQQIFQNMPPEKLQVLRHEAQQIVNSQQFQPTPMLLQQPQTPVLHYTTTPPQGLFGSKQSSVGHGSQTGPRDDKQTGKVQRFLGDTLFGRVARASVQTATSALKMPASLSPWGDNNPVTLPNVRYRDAVLFTTFAFVGAPLVDGISDGITGAFGADSFVSEIISSGAGTITGDTIIKYGVFQIVEQAIDKGIIEHMLPEEEKMLQTTNVKSLQVGIKHKLMGVDADLRFSGIYPTTNAQACEKGWFCPYLFASARTPQIPRANDFAICQFFGPFLNGDYLMAHKLLSESVHTLSLCDPNPQTDIGTNRMVVVFTGISPYRGSMWSQSRRPGCGTIIFHLLDGCPALVLPVTNRAPICAWSPWTLSQMRTAQHAINPQVAGTGGYSAEWQHEQICEWLDTIVSVQHLSPAIQGRYVEVLGRSVSLVLNGALALDKCQPLLGKLDPERAGIVMFRY